jgi:hypothetical protein
MTGWENRAVLPGKRPDELVTSFPACALVYNRGVESRLLIDALVRQTTVLIAQLATSAGIRAPLANVAAQVFLDLATEIEQQGVSRNVAADMFGLALRSYQRKVNRLREGATVPAKTLWQSVLDHVREHGTRTRSQLLESFGRDEPEDVISVLNDLVGGGLLFATGRGRSAAYGATTDSDQQTLVRERSFDTFVHLVWLALAEPPGLTRAELASRFAEHVALLDDALAKLVCEGRVRSEGEGEPRYFAGRVLIPVGSEVGWESAVFDHYRAMCAALVNKIRLGGAAAAAQALIGGVTLSFDLYPGHPFEHEVKGLLARTRKDVLELWQRVADFNAKHPPREERLEKVVFYAGQNFVGSDSSEGQT